MEGKKNKNREAGLDQKLRIVLSLIWPEIKNYEAEPIWGILIKKEGVYSTFQSIHPVSVVNLITESEKFELRKLKCVQFHYFWTRLVWIQFY